MAGPTEDKENVLVIGGSGFLGSHVCDTLSEDSSFAVVVASRRPGQHHPSHAIWRGCDITKPQALVDLISDVKPDVVIHTATPGPFSMMNAQAQHYSATKQLLEEAKKSKSVRAFIYTGSCESLKSPPNARGTGLKEEEADFYTLTSGPTPYAKAKAACQALVLEYNTPPQTSSSFASDTRHSETGFQNVLLTTVLCTPGIYGPRDTGITPGIFKLPTRLQLGPKGGLHDWIYVENAAHAFALAVKALLSATPHSHRPDEKVDGELFFITDDEPINFWDFARKVKVAAGDQVAADPSKTFVVPWVVVLVLATVSEWVYWVFTLGNVVSSFNPKLARYIKDGRVLEIGKARTRLGYEPLVSMEEGINRSVGWISGQDGS